MFNRNIISAVRFGLSISLSFFAAKYFAFQNPYWAPTTIIIVEGINFGSFSEKILPRFSGNLTGAFIGLGFISLFLQIPLLYTLILSIYTGILIYAVLKGKNPLFWRWTLISTLLITLYNTNSPHNAFDLGMDRVACVSTGLLINFLFHQFFYFRSAESDYFNSLENLFAKLSFIAQQKAEKLKRHDFTPVKGGENLFKIMESIKIEFENACRDEKRIMSEKHLHEKQLELLEETASIIIFLSKEKETYYNHDDIEKIISCLSKVSLRLKKLHKNFLFTGTDKFSHPNNEKPSPEDGFRVLSAYRALDNLYKIKNISCEKKDIETKKRPGVQNHVLPSVLAGLSVFISMMLWKTTGWPGGMMMPLLTMLIILYFHMFPEINIKSSIIIQTAAVAGAAFISFFILPCIHSTEFFFIFLTTLYFLFGLMIHSSKVPLRGLGLILAVLVNSCVYGYTPTLFSFNVISTYILLIIGADLVAFVIIIIFYKNKSLEKFIKLSKKISSPESSFTEANHDKNFSFIISGIKESFMHAYSGLDNNEKYHALMIMSGAKSLKSLSHSDFLFKSQIQEIKQNLLFHTNSLSGEAYKKNEI